MSQIGNIVIFPKGGAPSSEPAAVVRQVLEAFEGRGLLQPGTAQALMLSQDASATFAAYLDEASLPPDEYAYVLVPPERLTSNLGSLVYVLDLDEDGNPGPIELPFMHVSVFARPAPLHDSTLGEDVARS